jgi:ribonuclease E
VARQLRLRDLAGLIVIDFIDMEENRNNRAVEKKLKDCLKNDRARIQVGRISHFGLMEMSRQRIRASVLESTMKPCPHCGGTGHVRSDSSVALLVVRAIEEFLLKDSKSHITVRTPAATALYVLNHKRSTLVEMEQRFGVTITIEADDGVGTQHYAIFRGALAEKPEGFSEARPQPYVAAEEPDEDIVVEEEDAEAEEQPRQQQPAQEHRSQDGDRKRRRRRRRRGGRDRDHENGAPAQGETGDEHADGGAEAQDGDDAEGDVAAVANVESVDEAAADDAQPKKRRRGKRGGKRNRQDGEAEDAVSATGEEPAEAETAPQPEAEAAAPAAEAPVAANDDAPAEKPKRARRSTKAKKAAEETKAEVVPAEAAVAGDADVQAAEPAEASPKPEAETKARPSRRKPASPAAAEPVVSSTVATPDVQAEDKPKRAGWWQRKGFF